MYVDSNGMKKNDTTDRVEFYRYFFFPLLAGQIQLAIDKVRK